MAVLLLVHLLLSVFLLHHELILGGLHLVLVLGRERELGIVKFFENVEFSTLMVVIFSLMERSDELVDLLDLGEDGLFENRESVAHGVFEGLLSVVSLLLVDESGDALGAGIDDLHHFLLVLVYQLVHLAHVLFLFQLEQFLQESRVALAATLLPHSVLLVGGVVQAGGHHLLDDVVLYVLVEHHLSLELQVLVHEFLVVGI